jgi:hypothetical protein
MPECTSAQHNNKNKMAFSEQIAFLHDPHVVEAPLVSLIFYLLTVFSNFSPALSKI